MQTRETAQIRIARQTACAWLLTAGFMMIAPLASSAQFAQPVGSNFSTLQSNTMSNAENTTGGGPEIGPNGPMGWQGPAVPEPPGDGPTPANLIPGDNSAPTPPPTGNAQSNPANGSMFSTGTGTNRTIIHIYRQTNGGLLGQSRGTREVQTLRPDQMSSQQWGQVQSILGANLGSGEGNVEVTVSDSQLEQLNAVFAPYPGYSTNSAGYKSITQDQPATGYPKNNEQSIYSFQGPLPTVQKFCRYLVILGVVAATIWVAMGATSIVFGDGYGGAKVVGAIAGLMMLLCGYTVWKVVQMNTFKANSNAYINNSRTTNGQVSTLGTPNLPAVPQGVVPGPSRFGIPLVPLGDYNSSTGNQ